MNEQTTILEHRFCIAYEPAASQQLGQGKNNDSNVWGKFLAAEPPVSKKNGPSHSSRAPPKVFTELTQVSLLAG